MYSLLAGFIFKVWFDIFFSKGEIWMRALVWTAPESMEIQKKEIPVPKHDEVLIEVEAVGICGSEIEGYLGHNSLRVPPLVMGHEFCGRIKETGTDVSSLTIGQKVVVNPLISCGTCDRCRRGLENLCDVRSIVGIHRAGAFAQYVVVPAANVHVVPDGLNAYRAALTEPLACSLRATRRALQDHPFAQVVVVGAGTIGLLSGMVSKILGASRLIVADTNPERLAGALQSGADGVVNPREEDAIGRIKELAGSGGVDVVIDAAGFQPTREMGIRLLNPGGTLMNIGLGIDETSLPINYTIRSEIQILGSFCYSRQDFYDSLKLLIEGKVTEEGWSEIRGMSDGNGAFADLVAGKVSNGKIFLNPNE